MVKVEELLEPGETVLKKDMVQSGRSPISAYAHLYLTNRRVIYIPSELLSFVFGGYEGLIKRGLHNIPLNTITVRI